MLYTLKDAGFEAYIVGGGVRDLLAGLTPKDFDIATNARPEQMRGLFRNCRTIGRRFVICHVRMGDEVLEVTTFRGPITASHERDETGRILSDNEYGTLEQDAFRRDFTVNALYYDIRDFAVVDFTGGLQDLQAKSLRLIGEPETRYREDPVRMIRAVRIANKLGFHLEENTAAPMLGLNHLLAEIPPARLFDEVIKVLQSEQAVANLRWLRSLGLFAQLMPDTERLLARDAKSLAFVEQALTNTARRLAADQTVSPAFLYAALLWPVVRARFESLVAKEGMHPNVAISQASEEALARALARIAIPKRFSFPMREIWVLQARFPNMQGGRAKRLPTHPRFRAAYDFLLVRAQVGEVPQEMADFWTTAQIGITPDPLPSDEEALEDEAAPTQPHANRRRRRGGRNRGRPSPTAS